MLSDTGTKPSDTEENKKLTRSSEIANVNHLRKSCTTTVAQVFLVVQLLAPSREKSNRGGTQT